MRVHNCTCICGASINTSYRIMRTSRELQEVRRAWELENGTILRIPDSEDQEVSQIRIALIARARNFRFSDIQFDFEFR
eukprot:COSAG02_NODE_4383_length_5424_cov_2.023099_2_plen_79_part_00